jgi:predicted metal-dependent peptidase
MSNHTGLSADLIFRFMSEQPFFYGVWVQLRTRWVGESELPTYGGVCHSGDGFTLILNRERWATLDDTSKIFLLAHECAHVALGHVPPDEMTKQLIPILVNVAQDLIINEHFPQYRGSAIGQDGQWLSMYPKLPQSLQDLEWRKLYDLLTLEMQEQAKGKGFDDHSFASDGDNPGQQGKPGDGDGEGEAPTLSNGELAKVQAEDIARQAARHCQLRGQESGIPQQIKVMIERPKKTHIQMVRELLQRFVTSSRDTRKRATWKRTSRRLGPIARGRMSARRPNVAVAVDSSGSMCNPETIELMCQAISAVCAVADEVTCVVGDTEVRAETKLTPGNVATEFNKAMLGGGGTTLQPLLDRLVEAGRYDAVILVTDGYCENLQAKQPTVALITPGGVDAPGLRQSVHLKTVAP